MSGPNGRVPVVAMDWLPSAATRTIETTENQRGCCFDPQEAGRIRKRMTGISPLVTRGGQP